MTTSSTIEWTRWDDCAAAVTWRDHGRQNTRSLRPDRASGGPGGAAVWLDAMLTEQVAQPLEFTVQSLVLRDDGPATSSAAGSVSSRSLSASSCLSRSRRAAAPSRSPALKAASFPGVPG
jgi:hypothetical protein